jgi:hypothetical protein
LGVRWSQWIFSKPPWPSRRPSQKAPMPLTTICHVTIACHLNAFTSASNSACNDLS